MKSRDFAFWLQGFFELRGPADGISAQQAAIIQQHLSLVFQHDSDIAAKPHPTPDAIPNSVTVAGWPGGSPPLMIC